MRVILILLTILVAGGAIVWLIDRLFYHKQTAENADETVQNAADSDGSAHGCTDDACGLRSICQADDIRPSSDENSEEIVTMSLASA